MAAVLALAAAGCGNDDGGLSPDGGAPGGSDAAAPQQRCEVDCDCPQGMACASGRCVEVVTPIYCCEKAGCPQGDRCVDEGGAVDTCAACVVDCDCPQGLACSEGECVETDEPTYCCGAEGCSPGAACTDMEGRPGECEAECEVSCDCPQGQICTSSGLCVQGVEPSYCCDNSGCPVGEACVDAEGEPGMCVECRVDCDCPQGQICTSSGLCVQGVDPSYCCDKPACPGGASCTDREGQTGTCTGEDTCGNGTTDPGERCDAACPTDCDDGNVCTTDRLMGSAETCSAVCEHAVIQSCTGGDGCCPAACDAATDSDCPDTCGNGMLDPGETCDGDCPTSCDDGNACTRDSLTGNPASCTAECAYSPVTACMGGDGCCPAGCTSSDDSDCGGGTTSIGAACTSNAACDGGACITNWTDGYCSLACTDDDNCGAGSHCGTGLYGSNCLDACSSGADCRSGYDCVDADHDTRRECVPLGTGSGQVGDPCDQVDDCAGGSRAICGTDGFKDGYCSLSCSGSGEACPTGTHCSPTGVCVVSCESSDECRPDGYACFDGDRAGNTECWPAGTGDGEVGDPCQAIWDCAGGGSAMCLGESNGYPDGYCTVECGFGGFPGAGACPEGSHCGIGQAVCLQSCSGPSDCRSGYTCEDHHAEFFQDPMDECWPPASS